MTDSYSDVARFIQLRAEFDSSTASVLVDWETSGAAYVTIEGEAYPACGSTRFRPEGGLITVVATGLTHGPAGEVRNVILMPGVSVALPQAVRPGSPWVEYRQDRAARRDRAAPAIRSMVHGPRLSRLRRFSPARRQAARPPSAPSVPGPLARHDWHRPARHGFLPMATSRPAVRRESPGGKKAKWGLF